MKVTLKTLTSKLYPVEIQPTDSVLTLKQKVEAEHTFPVASQNLVYNGRVMQDSQTLSELGINDGSMIIFFVKKIAAKPSAPTSQPTAPQPSTTTETASSSAPSSTPSAAQPASQPSSAQPISAQPTATQSAPTTSSVIPASSSLQSSAPSASASVSSATPQSGTTGTTQQSGIPDVDDNKIEELVSMGFDREESRRALRAAFGEVSVAAEYLMSGIPEDLAGIASGMPLAGGMARGLGQAPPMPQLGALPGLGAGGAGGFTAPPSSGVGAGVGAGTGTTGGSGSALEQLRASPQLPQLQAMIRQNPAALSQVIQMLSQQNPQLAVEAQQDPIGFTAVLMGVERGMLEMIMAQEAASGQLGGMGGFGGMGGMGGMGGAGAGAGEGMPGEGIRLFGDSGAVMHRTSEGIAVAISQEDKTSIEHIKEVTGASDQQALEAYFACQKSVEGAINFLFDS
ncbi:UV excision repair protein RAD23 [Monocercomonoides exilis]|uniref:UV excision repair protein RAD23 n=1 Tax=Monocercomonoides exilis TaxID=2049356 RepID=UPI003559948D|nr:UV excision repair protein RAD23 [Monocercomonoides exilis]|eukprot:MONOS_318.1-p1 / transcript=MONOS_318.1 / gene=MONOS_318 / organism=Monocercomonoides_exilis_PA203 / gene_product=UV excision repair protein RAD23 homolog / transcript_product=UV excision repair protein RAD23 homolog / location=Mono_scaffold00005:137844-139361(-) / protein_length=455 / sequence_SO=supercontig / SO=protein_coding / is_pseudo=false